MSDQTGDVLAAIDATHVVPVQRLTIATRMVMAALIAAQGETYGYEVGRATGLPSGSTTPILHRLEAAGYITARWEDGAEPKVLGRPPRRYIRLTEAGKAWARRRRITPCCVTA